MPGALLPYPPKTRWHKPEETLEITLLLSFNNSFKITILDKRWDVLRVTQRQLTCAQSKEFFPGEFIPPIDPKSFAIVKKKKNWTSSSKQVLSVQRYKTGSESLFLCSSKFIVMCPFMLLPVRSSDYKLPSNKRLQHIATGPLYKFEIYLICSINVMLIC